MKELIEILAGIGAFIIGVGWVINYLKKIREDYEELNKCMDQEIKAIKEDKIDRNELKEYIALVVQPIKEAIEEIKKMLYDKVLEIKVRHDS